MKKEAAERHRRGLLASRHASAARDRVSRRRFPVPSNDPAGPRLGLRQEIGEGTAAVWLSVGGLQRAARLACVIAAGGATYFAALWLLGFRVSDFARRRGFSSGATSETSSPRLRPTS